MKQRNIFLIGPMACGKSAVGKVLARKLRRRFCDVDDLIASEANCGIAAIFAREGEAGFRRREAAALRRVASRRGWVVATGGGAVLQKENRDLMKQNGVVVYLEVRRDVRLARAGVGRDRPLLDCDDPAGAMENLDRTRSPLYEALADFKVNNTPPPDETAAKIARLIEATTGDRETDENADG